jgi:hypothetical protein
LSTSLVLKIAILKQAGTGLRRELLDREQSIY